MGNEQNIRFYSANRCDCNGNRRIIVHYLDFLLLEEFLYTSTDDRYDLACKRAKRAGFRRFNTKEFGGGFICQYDFCNCKDIAKRIMDAIATIKA